MGTANGTGREAGITVKREAASLFPGGNRSVDTLIKNRDCEMGGSRNGPWSEERRKDYDGNDDDEDHRCL